MTNVPGTFVHDWFDRVWNQQRAEAIDDLMTGDAVLHGLKDAAGCDLKGCDGFKPLHSAFLQAFPDLHVEVTECVNDADRMAFRCTVRGTHQGDGLGIAPTGKAVEFIGLGFITVRDGKITEAWNSFDFESMYRQLGVQPPR